MGRLAGRRARRLAARGLVAALCLGAIALLGACATGGKPTARGATHVVERGENLYRIALRYGVTVDDIVRANDIDDATKLEVGQVLRIPGVGEVRALDDENARTGGGHTCGVPPEAKRSAQKRAQQEADVAFAWPLRGGISTCFGERRSRAHEGIDIMSPSGTEIRAAEAGKVVFAGSMGAYGKIIILKHEGPYASVYSHNSRHFVEKGAFVEKGDVIAEVGATGNATGPHLHFEIRREDRAQDPIQFLP